MGGFVKSEIVMFLLAVLLQTVPTHGHLEIGFYNKTCPNVEKIVGDFVQKHIHNTPSLAAPILRLLFHDCFVRGCDASLLLESTPANGNNTEKNSPTSLTLRGFDFIDRVKSQVESECNGVVSCADILALVARDAILAISGPYWTVPMGRRDGLVSNGAETLAQIPFPTDNFTTLLAKFKDKGLNRHDLVILSGAHTIGTAHCASFAARLYNFTGKCDVDPTMDPTYAANLKSKKCPKINSTGLAEMDPGSSKTFDSDYYEKVLDHMGLFTSDAELLTEDMARSIIEQIAKGSINFFEEFAASMVKMGNIGVKAGDAGEIRKVCTKVNS